MAAVHRALLYGEVFKIRGLWSIQLLRLLRRRRERLLLVLLRALLVLAQVLRVLRMLLKVEDFSPRTFFGDAGLRPWPPLICRVGLQPRSCVDGVEVRLQADGSIPLGAPCCSRQAVQRQAGR